MDDWKFGDYVECPRGLVLSPSVCNPEPRADVPHGTIPEPGTLALIVPVLVVAAIRRWRRK